LDKHSGIKQKFSFTGEQHVEQFEGAPSYTKLKNRELSAQTSKIGKASMPRFI